MHSSNKERLQQRIGELQQRWNLLSEVLEKLERARILEPREYERLHLESKIAENETERQVVETELTQLEAELAKLNENTEAEAQEDGQTGPVPTSPSLPLKWELFVCSVPEDQQELVQPLANALQQKGLRVTYKSFETSLLRLLNKGLAKSQYLVVILSSNFFFKHDWPPRKLLQLAQRAERESNRLIFLVWSNAPRGQQALYEKVLSVLPGLSEVDARDVMVKDRDEAVQRILKKLHRFQFETIFIDRNGKIRIISKTARQIEEDLRKDQSSGKPVVLEMVAIPAGAFQMGASAQEKSALDNESPQHTVTIPAFYLNKYPVTQAQWETVVNAVPPITRPLKAKPTFKGPGRPVEQVSWEEAEEFCRRLSQLTGRPYRLPTEAEWEYACRAGTTTPFHFGATITPFLANYGRGQCASKESYKLTEQSFEELQSKGVPKDIVEALKSMNAQELKNSWAAVQAQFRTEQMMPSEVHILEYILKKGLKNQKFYTKDEFLEAVRDRIGTEQAATYQEVILEHTRDTYSKQTITVGEFLPNAFGIYDLHGNVWEWCADVWHDNYAGAPTDGNVWSDGGETGWRVLRGGSWSDPPEDLRCARREKGFQDNKNRSWGFRLACSYEPPDEPKRVIVDDGTSTQSPSQNTQPTSPKNEVDTEPTPEKLPINHAQKETAPGLSVPTYPPTSPDELEKITPKEIERTPPPDSHPTEGIERTPPPRSYKEIEPIHFPIKERRVDAAVPSNTEVDQPIDLFIQVRFPKSPTLDTEVWPERRKPGLIEQVSESIDMEFPVNPQTGKRGSAYLEIRVIAPDFVIAGSNKKVIEVPAKKYSKRISFLLTPKRAGACRINIDAYNIDDIYLGTVPIETMVGKNSADVTTLGASLILSVFVKDRKQTTWKRGMVQRQKELEADYDIFSEKIARLRKAWAIETDPARKLQWEQQINDAERDRAAIETELQAILTPGQKVVAYNRLMMMGVLIVFLIVFGIIRLCPIDKTSGPTPTLTPKPYATVTPAPALSAVTYTPVPSPTPLPVIQLRSKPQMVSDDKFRDDFQLDPNRKPLTYIENKFANQGNVVVDYATGLMWWKSESEISLTYEQSKDYIINQLNHDHFAGFNDWRLPTIPELLSLLKSEKQANTLYIDQIFNAKQSWLWSADQLSSNSAWGVDFSRGLVDWSNNDKVHYVRGVRSWK